MATAFAHDIPSTPTPLARAAGKLALVASAGAEAIAAGLGTPPLTFAEARAKVCSLIEAEKHLPDGSTDEDVEAGSDRTEQAFKTFFAMPASTADEALQKINVVRALWEAHETPYLAEAMDELRALVLAPAVIDCTGDETLLAAWERWKAASTAIEGSGGDSDTDDTHIAARDQAEQFILEGKASTAAGLLCKLRFALDCTHMPVWGSRALYAGDDQVLLDRIEELDADSRLIADAIGFLSRPSPGRTAWDQALVALGQAKAAATARNDDLSIAESDALTAAWTDADDHLLDMPAPDMAALIWKLEWLCQPETGQCEEVTRTVLADARRLAGLPLPLPAPSPVRQAFEAWIAARIAYDVADSALEPDEDPEYTGWIEAERMLAATPPQSAEDMLFKLFPLALSEHGPTSYEGTFGIAYKPEGPADAPYLDDDTWRGLIDGMLALSPRLAEVVAMPPVRAPEIKADMWLPDAGVPLDQMREWLGHLISMPGVYAKLWLRLAASANISAQVFVDKDGQERFWLGSDMDDCSPEFMEVDQGLRAMLKASGHRQAVIDQLKATGRVSDLRRAVAA